jgi:hypothetical protein
MSDAPFNPYHQWLGLERSITRPNHYQLLGVEPSEQNAERIAQAANRALVKVRSCSPGPRNAEWARLIEEITAAASCLCDPVRRVEYDRSLGLGGGRSFNRPAPRSRVAPAAGGGPRALPMHAPPGGTAARPQTPSAGNKSAAPMAPVVPIAAATPAGASPAYGQPAGHGTPSYGAPGPRARPGGRGQQPAAVPVASAPTGNAGTPVSVAPSPLVGKPQSATVKVRRRKQSSSLMLLAVATGVVMLLVGAVILGVVLSRTRDNRSRSGARPVVRATPLDAARTPGASTTRTPTPPIRPAPSGEPPATESAPPVEHELSTNLQEETADAGTAEAGLRGLTPGSASSPPAESPAESPTDPASNTPLVSEPPAEAPAEMPGTTASSDADLTLPKFPPAPTLDPLNKTVAQPLSPEAESPPNGETEPFQPNDASSSTDVTPEERTALAKALQTAHAAVLDRRYDEAMEELDAIATLPKLPEHHARYERLMLLAGYAKNFQAALQSAIAGLHPGDQIEVGGSTVVGFVSAAPGSITLRVTGTNRTYALENLPVGLAVALADRWLDKEDPVSLAVKGAYLAALKETTDERRTRARQWLEEASQRGVEGELHKVLDDRYDLEATSQ